MTGVAEEGRDALNRRLAAAGARVVEETELRGDVAAPLVAGASLHNLRARLDAGRVFLLTDDEPKATIKLLYGLACGLHPRRPAWADACLKAHALLPPDAAAHLARLPSSRWRVGSRDALFGGTLAVLAGGADWCATWAPVLRAAGAEVRRELPPLHHETRADGTCVVLVPKEEHQQQGAAGLVGRARERGVGVASVEWVKQCLLQQKNLPTRGFPPPQ